MGGYCSLFAGLAAGFTVAAAAVALIRSQEPFDHGWWLVAYLALVGGLSQLIFGAGQFALAAGPAGPRMLASEVVFWNLGAVLVPVGVFAGAPGLVAVGSVVLLAALALFASATSVPRLRCANENPAWLYAYRAVVIFLAGSVSSAPAWRERSRGSWRDQALRGKNACAMDAYLV